MHHDLVTRHSGYSTNNSKRNTSDSHRSLQLFKNRVFTPNSVVQKRVKKFYSKLFLIKQKNINFLIIFFRE